MPRLYLLAEELERTMNLDRRFLIWALGFAAVGISLGLYMEASENHGELVTHALILLVGFVLSLVYGIIHSCGWMSSIERLRTPSW
jgi:hypothetical protein